MVELIEGVSYTNLFIIFIWLCYGVSWGFGNMITKLFGFIHGRVVTQAAYGRLLDWVFVLVGFYLYFEVLAG